MCAMRYECGGGGGVMRHGLRRAVLWPGVCGAVVYAVFIVVRRAEWWRARVSVSVFAYTCGRDRYDAARIIMCVENVGFRTGLPDAGAHSTVLFFIRRDS